MDVRNRKCMKYLPKGFGTMLKKPQTNTATVAPQKVM